MLESTNALIGALIAVMRETHRCENLVQGGALPESEEEEMGSFIEQLHEALADLTGEYELRRQRHATLPSVDDLRMSLDGRASSPDRSGKTS